MTSMFKTRFKSVAAATFGNALEWYDFGVYTFVAGILSKAFFPPGDDAAALLATFAVFGLGFVVRPIGAAVLGRLGDVIGRKTPLVITMGLMGLGTLAIGFIPTYASIGILGTDIAGFRSACAKLFGRRGIHHFDHLSGGMGSAGEARLLWEPAAMRNQCWSAGVESGGACRAC